METINHECYVSLEVAKLLKEAGFKWGCRAAWDLTFPNEPYLNHAAVYPTDFNNDVDDILYAPTIEVAQRWLRKVKNIAVYVCPSYEPIGNDADDKWIMKWQVDATFEDIEIVKIGLDEVGEEMFDTYEESLESGEKKALEIILEKG